MSRVEAKKDFLGNSLSDLRSATPDQICSAISKRLNGAITNGDCNDDLYEVLVDTHVSHLPIVGRGNEPGLFDDIALYLSNEYPEQFESWLDLVRSEKYPKMPGIEKLIEAADRLEFDNAEDPSSIAANKPA